MTTGRHLAPRYRFKELFAAAWVLALLLVVSLAMSGFTVGSSEVQAAVNPYEAPRIGVVGCSNTAQSLSKYAVNSEVDSVWTKNVNLGGGHLAVWADIDGVGASYWSGFQSNLEIYGAHSVWLQLCIREAWSSSTGMTTEQQAMLTTVIDHIRSLTSPTVEVYVSPLNTFEVNDCYLTGPYGVPNSIELADWAASTGLGLRGPDLGPLTSAMVEADGCHPNRAGKTYLGPQVADFFDQVDVSPDAEPAYWCVDGSVVAISDGSTPTGSYVAGPFSTTEAAAADPGCAPPATAYWCVDGAVVSTDGSTPNGSYVAGPYGSEAEAAADPGCAPAPPGTTYWCVDGTVVTVTDGSSPTGGYVAGPYANQPDAAGDPGCVVPRISTSTNPIYAGQPVTFTDYYTGTHKRRWTMGDGSVFNNNSQTLTYTYPTPGTYTVSLGTRGGGARITITRTISVLAP